MAISPGGGRDDRRPLLTPDNVQGSFTTSTAMVGDQLRIRVLMFADPRWEKVGRLQPVPRRGGVTPRRGSRFEG